MTGMDLVFVIGSLLVILLALALLKGIIRFFFAAIGVILGFIIGILLIPFALLKEILFPKKS